MVALGISLAVVDATGSFVVAGVAVAAFVLPLTVASPLWSRAADRWPPRRILVITGCAQAVATALFAGAAATGVATPVLVVLCAAIGCVPPPTVAVTRATWSRTLADDADARTAALSLESILTDVAYVAGPAAVAGLSALVSPTLALLTAAVALLVGNLALAATRRVRSVPGADRGGDPRAHWLGALRTPPVVATLPVGFLLMGSLAATELSLVASTDAAASTGLLVAVLSLGGVIGGLIWGRRARDPLRMRALGILLAALAVLWALLAVPAPVALVVAILFAAGLALSPSIIAHYELMHAVAPARSLTESFGWLSAAGSAGAGAASLPVGFVVARAPHAGFLIAAGLAGLAVVYLALVRRAFPDAVTGAPETVPHPPAG